MIFNQDVGKAKADPLVEASETVAHTLPHVIPVGTALYLDCAKGQETQRWFFLVFLFCPLNYRSIIVAYVTISFFPLGEKRKLLEVGQERDLWDAHMSSTWFSAWGVRLIS